MFRRPIPQRGVRPPSSIPRHYPPARERNGGLVITSTSGSGKSDIFFVTPKFQFVANGLYEAPFGINVAANLLIRQGYGQPYYQEIEARARDPYALKDVLLVPDVGGQSAPGDREFRPAGRQGVPGQRHHDECRP